MIRKKAGSKFVCEFAQTFTIFKRLMCNHRSMDMPEHPFGGAELAAAQRGKPRDSIFLGAVLWFDENPKRHEARVRNISAGGMMVDHAKPVAMGSVVHADIRGIGEVSGKVAWARDGRLGIAFDWEVDPSNARLKPGAKTLQPIYSGVGAATRFNGFAR